MNAFGVDYAWGRPSTASLKNAGVTFACRYLSHDTSGKNLDHAEAVRLSNAGIWLVPVWESTAMRALDGHVAGVQDARDADAQAKACGMPAGRPIYFATDWDVQSSQLAAVNAYLDGAASVLGKGRTGIYGGYRAVKSALDGGHATWAWQTYGWSGIPTKWDPRAQIQQYSNDHTIGGVGLDYDRATKADYGQWKVGVSPNVTPTPPPTPQQEDDMPYGIVKNGTDKTNPTVHALPEGRHGTIGLNADNGLQGLLPASVRVAMQDGAGHWTVAPNTIVDSSHGQTVLHLPTTCVCVSIVHEDAAAVKDASKVDVNGAVNVAYEIS